METLAGVVGLGSRIVGNFSGRFLCALIMPTLAIATSPSVAPIAARDTVCQRRLPQKIQGVDGVAAATITVTCFEAV